MDNGEILVQDLVCPFLNQSETFVLGFECGQLWCGLENGTVPNPDKAETWYTFHTKNIEQIKIIAAKFGFRIVIESQDDTWAVIQFVKNNTNNVLTLVKNNG